MDDKGMAGERESPTGPLSSRSLLGPLLDGGEMGREVDLRSEGLRVAFDLFAFLQMMSAGSNSLRYGDLP
jgi:hypothetical protein